MEGADFAEELEVLRGVAISLAAATLGPLLRLELVVGIEQLVLELCLLRASFEWRLLLVAHTVPRSRHHPRDMTMIADIGRSPKRFVGIAAINDECIGRPWRLTTGGLGRSPTRRSGRERLNKCQILSGGRARRCAYAMSDNDIHYHCYHVLLVLDERAALEGIVGERAEGR